MKRVPFEGLVKFACVLVASMTLAACAKGSDANANANANGAPSNSGAPSAAVPGAGGPTSLTTTSVPDAGAGAPKTVTGSAPGGTDAPSAAGAFKGTYKSAAAQMHIPREGDAPNAKEWDNVKFRGDDAGIGLGDGAVAFSIDEGGRVTGTLDGAVGAATLSGMLTGNRFAATVARKDGTDDGLTGTAWGELKGKTIEGHMRLSESNARVVREASFTASAAGAP